MKRTFDMLVAVIGLFFLFPLFIVAAALIKVDSHGPVFFRQERIGRDFRPFLIYKFRTMVENAAQIGSVITYGGDPRITRIGRFLRKTKIDELPQIINVLKGEMSFVGPRPEVRKYVELFPEDYQEILKIRPGITDLASLKYQDEAELLGTSASPEEDYVKRILPDKLKLAKDYVQCSSLTFDIGLMLKTVPKLIGCRARPG
jgi:lipopolysaccharide/colanic/teichoic acid biosynthesis glycosyltransferase